MDIKEILLLPFHLMTQKVNLKVLVDAYRNELGKSVCVSCPGSLNQMILLLKKHNNMSNFRIKNDKYYRISKESGRVINNNIITDELAIEFLKGFPERIQYFDVYPENWKEITGTQVDTTEEEVEREELMKLKIYELREQYPDIKETSKGDFITAIFNTRD